MTAKTQQVLLIAALLPSSLFKIKGVKIKEGFETTSQRIKFPKSALGNLFRKQMKLFQVLLSCCTSRVKTKRL